MKANTAQGQARPSGIDVLSDLPWGTHLCHFYRAKEELLDILVPYFRAGLENNEFCLWITAGLFGERDAEEAIRNAVPDFHRLYHARGQIEIADARWYFKDDFFNLPPVLSAQGGKVSQALARHYDGVRIAVNVSWLDKKNGKSSSLYEAQAGKSMDGQPVISLCSYPLAKWGITESLDVIANHRFALIKRQNRWQVLTLSDSETAEDAPPGTERLVSIPDITERQQAEEPSTESEERLKICLDS